MSVKDIEAAIAQLPRQEIAELSRWFEEFQNRVWDEQIERDANAGRFDTLIEHAKTAIRSGTLQTAVKHHTTPDETHRIALYREFEIEDRELAEAGIADYAQALPRDDEHPPQRALAARLARHDKAASV